MFTVAMVPGYEERIRDLEIFRLKMILRLLKISSFNGKMNALNEVNKVSYLLFSSVLQVKQLRYRDVNPKILILSSTFHRYHY
mgnify:CR=1 FL=1